jgi:hypothetical protein
LAQPYRVVLRPTAFRRLLALSPDERTEALGAIEEIRADPTPDERRKRAFALRSDVHFWMYDGDLVWITDQVIDFEVISILTIVPRRGQH